MLKTISEKVRLVWMIALLVMILVVAPAYAVINRIVGNTVTHGWGLQADGDSTEFNATQAWTDSLWEMVYEMIDTTTAPIPLSDSTDLITHDRIMVWHFGDEDWGDMSVSSNVVTLDADVVGTDEMADGDHGDFTYSGGSATLDAGVVADNEIDYSAVTLDDFDYQTAWRIFYSNADGDVTELALGTSGQYLKANGVDQAPSWDTPGGSGDITDVGDGTTGAVFTEAGEGSKLWFEGATADDHDILLTSADPAAECTVTIPAETGNLVIEYDQFWGGAELAVKQGVDDEIAIYYPMSNDSNSYFVRHIHDGTTDNQFDTVVMAGYLPIGVDSDGVDSITFNMRTTGDATASAIQLKVFKRDGNDIGALALCDSLAIVATTAGAWEHKTTGALGEAQADAGDVIEVWFLVSLDTGELVEHDKPKIWYTGK